MLGSPLLGAAVGLVLLFATTSLLCSGITESLSNLFQMRAKYLLTGLRAMLDGPETRPGEGKATDKQLHEDVKNPQRTAGAVAEMRKTGAATTTADPATGAAESESGRLGGGIACCIGNHYGALSSRCKRRRRSGT